MPRSMRLLLCSLVLWLPACAGDGHFSVLGYTTRPNYEAGIRTVYVPIFENRTFRRGFEFELTRAVVREIEAKTPYKVVSNQECADTELIGVITRFKKGILNANQLNEVREAETTMVVEIVWRDRRTGEILSQPKRPEPEFPEGDPKPPKPVPTEVQSLATFIPELGQTLTSSERLNVNRLAIQIVSLMEKPW